VDRAVKVVVFSPDEAGRFALRGHNEVRRPHLLTLTAAANGGNRK